MYFYVMLFLSIIMFQSPLAVVDVITPVPAPPNISFSDRALPTAANQKNKTTPEVLPPLTKHETNKDYLKSLFDEAEVAKNTPPPLTDIKLYDKLVSESIAYGVLKENPNLKVGTLSFRPISHNSQHAKEIRKGQELLIHDFGNKSYKYKEIMDSISQQIADPKNPISDMDWILMANAFRTLKAPGTSNQAHILGSLLSEYVLLEEINKFEHKTPLTSQDRSLLSTLHYDLAQLYQSMYKNDEGFFQKGPRGQYLFPIDPVYFGNESGYNAPLEYLVPFDSLVATRLDLLENALLFDPDDETWAQIIDFVAFDLIDPWFYNELTPAFWADYFPHGLQRNHVEQLRHMWHDIRQNKEVRINHSLRLNQIGGERALRRLSVAHARPNSHLNRIIQRSLGTSSKTITPAKSRSLLGSAAKPSIKTSRATSRNRPFASMTAPRTQQQFIPHHATTQRATSSRSVVREYRVFHPVQRNAAAPSRQGKGSVQGGSGRSYSSDRNVLPGKKKY